MSEMQFKVDYHQIGTSEDLEDWAYTTVAKKILDSGKTTIKCNGSSSPKKEMHDLAKDFLAMVPDGRVLCVSKSTYRSKVSYIIMDNKNHETFLSFSYSKREKVKDCDFYLTTAHSDVAIAFEKYVKENFSNEKKNSVYVISQGDNGLTLQNMGPIEEDLVRENYPHEVVENYDYVLKQFSQNEPFGRLAIFNGEPGTGKTRLIRSMVGQITNCLVVLLPSKLIGEVDSPALMTLLAEEKAEYGAMDRDGEGKQTLPILFIIEDADSCLVPRENDNIMTISSLLNLTDGILGSMLDLRVIATTNQQHIDFDEALMRPGRLCKHTYVGLLEPEKASQVYNRLTGKEKEYKEKTSLAQVYADSQNKVETKHKKKSMGFLQ